jgi:hypothetical protein
MAHAPTQQRARKQYVCDVCRKPIEKGETYLRFSGILGFVDPAGAPVWGNSKAHQACVPQPAPKPVDEATKAAHASVLEKFMAHRRARLAAQEQQLPESGPRKDRPRRARQKQSEAPTAGEASPETSASDEGEPEAR